MVHLKRWTRFFETFPVGPNRSIEFWTEISGNFGWMDRARWFSPRTSKTSCFASVTFTMASKVFIEILLDILFRFLGFGDVKITVVIENQTFVTFAHLFTISEKLYQFCPRNVVKLQCLKQLRLIYWHDRRRTLVQSQRRWKENTTGSIPQITNKPYVLSNAHYGSLS